MNRNHDSHPDVIMIYQERDSVQPAIEHIMELKLKFKAHMFDPKKLHDLAQMKPKVLLLSSNDVKRTIQIYIDYLEEYGQHIAPHSAILLINNRESSCAYLACENGLFDNYVIINPFNEPHRLQLALLRELKIIENHETSSLEQLISEGEDELASCIEHGVALKRSFSHEVNECEKKLTSATNVELDNNEAKSVLQNIIGVTLEDMNDNISANIQGILDQLITLKISNQSIKQSIEDHHVPKKKSIVGVNSNLLASENSLEKGENSTLSYKVLIAEPSDLFSRVIEEMFSETVFKYLLVSDGKDALTQVMAFDPDVILMAYDLPKLNGIEITKAIRKDGNKVPIIAYTHQHDKSMIKSWIPLGLSGYLIKPSKKSLILKSIAKALKQPIDIIYHPKSADIGQIKWIPEYSVGNEEIDEQHKMLFTITNEFFHLKTKEAAIETFHNLSVYIDLHFEAEENLLRQINYPKTEEHIKKHDELRAKFQLLLQKLNDYDVDIHHKIALFLYNWLASHILKEDMDYHDYALSIEETSFSQYEI